MIRVQCPGCGRFLTIRDADPGALGQCPVCRTEFSLAAVLSVPIAEPAALPLEDADIILAQPVDDPPRGRERKRAASRERLPDEQPSLSDNERLHGSEPTNPYFLQEQRARRRRARRRQARDRPVLGLGPFVLALLAVTAMGILLLVAAIVSSWGAIALMVFGGSVSFYGAIWFSTYYRRDGNPEWFEPAAPRFGFVWAGGLVGWLIFHGIYGLRDPLGLGRAVLLEMIGFILLLFGLGLYLGGDELRPAIFQSPPSQPRPRLFHLPLDGGLRPQPDAEPGGRDSCVPRIQGADSSGIFPGPAP
jgi:hypothetical protein